MKNKLIGICVLFALSLPWPTLAKEIKVITYNIRYDTPADGINQWGKRKQVLIDLLQKQAPDILCIQEGLNNQVKDLAEALPDYFYVGVGRDDGKEKGEFSAIYFRKDEFELIKSNTFWLSPTIDVPGSKGWDAAITRICTYARVKYLPTQKEFFVFNTHFDHIGDTARTESARIILDQMRKLAGRNPILLCGDFNSEPNSRAYQLLMESKKPKLSESSSALPAAIPNCTFTGFEVNKGTCKHIDFIFYSRHFSWLRNQTITQNNGQYYPSDHLPVMAVFKL